LCCFWFSLHGGSASALPGGLSILGLQRGAYKHLLCDSLHVCSHCSRGWSIASARCFLSSSSWSIPKFEQLDADNKQRTVAAEEALEQALGQKCNLEVDPKHCGIKPLRSDGHCSSCTLWGMFKHHTRKGRKHSCIS
jgi:hypothetical protein